METIPSSSSSSFEGKDTRSGDWEVIDPITTSSSTTSTAAMTDNKSPKKPPPAVKGKPKVKPPSSPLSETTVAGVESGNGAAKKVPLVLPSAPLASVLQQGGGVAVNKVS